MNRRIPHAKDIAEAPAVIQVWRANGIEWSSIRVYLRWIRRFHSECRRREVVVIDQLNRESAKRWAMHYARTHGTHIGETIRVIGTALWAWSWGLQACGCSVPQWHAAPPPASSLSPLLLAFVQHRTDVRGVAESTIQRDLAMVEEFLTFMRQCGRTIARIGISDIDRFLAHCSRRLALKTLARVACTVRAFLGFLYTSGRIRQDLVGAVSTPMVRRRDQPPRVLPWSDVRRIIRAVDKTARSGLRDYALLLMMAVYGMGAGEVRGLTLDSVDWRRRQLRVVRPKTEREILLPMLPAVAQALAAYLRRGRPLHCTTRALFVRMHAPYGTLGSSGAIRHVLHKHALTAGVSTVALGSHVLRHSHACRQIDSAISVKVVGDILGHRRPESTSAYVRVALRRLRGMALPVPK